VEKKVTTSKKSAGESAKFDEIFTFPVTGGDEILHVKVYDDNVLKDDLIGECDIPLNELNLSGQKKWELTSKKLLSGTTRTGFIVLEGKWLGDRVSSLLGSQDSAIQIRVINLQGLENKSFITKNDPYVQLIIGGEKKETTTKYKAGEHAKFDEVFTFPVSGADEKLHVKVYDGNILMDDFIGECCIPLNELGASGQKQWELTSNKLLSGKTTTGYIVLEGKWRGSRGEVSGLDKGLAGLSLHQGEGVGSQAGSLAGSYGAKGDVASSEIDKGSKIEGFQEGSQQLHETH